MRARQTRIVEDMNREGRTWMLLGGILLAGLIAAAGYFAWTAPFSAKIRLGADRVNSEPYEMASAIAHVIRRTYPTIDVMVVETNGSSENMQLLARGEIDLALVRADAISRENVSLLAILYQEMFQLLVRQDSNIRTIKDLEGSRIAIPPLASGQYRAFWFLANQYGLAPERVNAFPMPGRQAVQAVQSGQVDAIFRVRGPRNFPIRMLINNTPLRMLPIDQGEAMHLRQPAFRAAMIPKGTYRGDPPTPASDLPTVGVDRLLVARDTLRKTVVRAITGILFEHRRDLALRTPLAALIRQPSLSIGTALPVHPGAVEYFEREKPSFLEEKAEFLALLVSLSALLASLAIALNRRFNERRKGRIEDYSVELLDLEKQAQTAETIPDLNSYKHRLTTILADVVADMRAGRINAEGLQLFAFIWESVNYTINDHEEQLRLGPGPVPPQRQVRSRRPKAKRA